MQWQNTVLEGIATETPKERFTSQQIEEQLSDVYRDLRLPEGRLELMTGIRQRGVWPRGTRSSEIAGKAGEKLIREKDIPTEEIDLLIHASVCRDFLEPSTASVVHSHLGLGEHATIFDLSNACLGVMSGMCMAAEMIERGSIRRALIVSGENGGPLLEDTIQSLKEKNQNGELTRKNIKKYLANLTIGSAGVAITLTHKNTNPKSPKLLGGVTMTDSKANILCQGDGNAENLMMETDSEALMHAGVELAQKTWSKAKDKFFAEHLPDWVLTHQVGQAHERLTLEALGLLEIPTVRTFPDYGNTGSAALPLTLHKLLTENSPQRGQNIALLGIGSGLTSTIMRLEC